MHKSIILLALFILFSSFANIDLHTPSSGSGLTTTTINNSTTEINLEKIASLKIKEIERIAGRKLNLKEKIAFKIYQFKLKKQLKLNNDVEKSPKGQTAFILGLIGICLLVIPYVTIAALPLSILAIVIGSKAKKENPKDKKAKTGIILGIITLGLFVVAFLFVLAVLASFGGWI